MISLKGIFLKIYRLELATKQQAEEGCGREQQKFGTRKGNGLKQSFARRLKTNQFTKLALVGIQWCMQCTSTLRSDQYQQQRLERLFVCVCGNSAIHYHSCLLRVALGGRLMIQNCPIF